MRGAVVGKVDHQVCYYFIIVLICVRLFTPSPSFDGFVHPCLPSVFRSFHSLGIFLPEILPKVENTPEVQFP